MPIDTSIYNMQPEPFNALDTYGKVQGIRNAQAQNALLQQELPILQQRQQAMQMENQQARAGLAINKLAAQGGFILPDGTKDYNGLIAASAKDPDAMYAIPTLMQERAANNARTQSGINEKGQPLYNSQQAVAAGFNPNVSAKPAPPSQDHINTVHSHLDNIQDTIKGLLDLPDEELDQSAIFGKAGDLIASGVPKTDVAKELGNIPAEDEHGNPPSPQVLRQYLQNHFDNYAGMQAHVTRNFGPPKVMGGDDGPQPVHLQHPGEAQALPQNAQAQVVAPAQAQVVHPMKVMDMPVGFTSPLPKSRQSYDEVTDAAKGAPQMQAAYNEIINLNAAGAPSGTKVSSMYQKLAQLGLAPKGITDKAAQTQEMTKWLTQALLSGGMPTSNERLQELQHGNLNPDQLSEVIKELAPTFKAMTRGLVEKQKFYNKATDNGKNLENEPAAAQIWNENYDPRWVEFDELSSAKDRKEFLLKHPDLIQKRNSHDALKHMGVIK